MTVLLSYQRPTSLSHSISVGASSQRVSELDPGSKRFTPGTCSYSLCQNRGIRNSSEGISISENRHAVRGSGLQTRENETVSSHYHYYGLRYTTTFKEAFLQNGIATLQNLDNKGWVAGSDVNVFVSNHDTERDSNSLNAYSPSNTYTLATLAHAYGTPSVLSSYSNFYNADAGGPNGGTGACSDTTDVVRWLCQHRCHFPQLRNWDTPNMIPLDPTDYPVWGATVYLPPNTAFEYKFKKE